MPRNGRITIIRKLSQLGQERRADELAMLEQTLHREWLAQNQLAAPQVPQARVVKHPRCIARDKQHAS
jgi:hypothetical protein